MLIGRLPGPFIKCDSDVDVISRLLMVKHLPICSSDEVDFMTMY